MPDDATLGNENSADTTPVIDWDSPDNPYIQRSRDQQSGYTKSQQELAAERAVWEDDQALIDRIRQQRPHLLAEDPAQAQEEDPYADLRQQTAELAAWKQQQEAAQQAQAEQAQTEKVMGLINADLDKWAKEAGVTLDEYGRAGIITRFGQDPAANDDDEATLKRHFDAYAASLPKPQRPRVPHVPSNGGTETGVVDYDNMTRAQIAAHMAEQVRAANQR